VSRRRRAQRLLRQLAFAGLGWASAAAAQDGGGPSFSLSGFGTLGATWHAREGVEFRRDATQPSGTRGNEVSLEPDSILGVQATAVFTPALEATVQLMSRNTVDAGYRPQVAWVYLKFKPSENSAVRFGRLGIELYMQGDAADIGYANPTMRQTLVIAPARYDGIDAETTLPLGPGLLRVKGMVGLTAGRAEFGGDVFDTSGAFLRFGLVDYMVGDLTLRAGGGRLEQEHEVSSPGYAALVAGLAVTPNARELIDAISLEGRRFDYYTVAAAYDSGRWFWLASLGAASSPGLPTIHGFSAHAGRRFGRFAPYVSWYGQHTKGDFVRTGIPAGLSPATDALNAAADIAQSSSRYNHHGLALGMRYELSSQSALKLQVDRIRYRNSDNIIDPEAAAEPSWARRTRSLTVWSAALEFVF